MDILTVGILLLVALTAYRVYQGIPGPVAGPRSSYDGLFYRYAIAHGVPARLMFAVVRVESDFNAHAVNEEKDADAKRGRDVDSLGLCQILYPDTARLLDPLVQRDDLFNPEINLNLGFRLMAGLLRAYPQKDADGFNSSAVAAYNAGSPRRTASGTFINQAYVDKVHRAWRTYA